jgi:hypothetical protein
MRDEPTMLSHKRNQNNDSLPESRARQYGSYPVTVGYLAATWALLGLTLILRGT